MKSILYNKRNFNISVDHFELMAAIFKIEAVSGVYKDKNLFGACDNCGVCCLKINDYKLGNKKHNI